MTKFKALPALGSKVILGTRTDTLPTSDAIENIIPQARAFYPWYRLCPCVNDVITVDTRPDKQFLVEMATSAVSRDRWICGVKEIVVIGNDILILGDYFQWTITLPGACRDVNDECSIAEVEIIGQAKSVYMLTRSL